MNDEQFDAMRAVQTAQGQVRVKRRELWAANRGLRRARRRLREAINSDPQEWEQRPNRFAYVDIPIDHGEIEGEVVDSPERTGS